jgi:hypothetical protein
VSKLNEFNRKKCLEDFFPVHFLQYLARNQWISKKLEFMQILRQIKALHFLLAELWPLFIKCFCVFLPLEKRYTC